MAYVDRIWLHDSKDKGMMRVYIKMQPAGDVHIDVKLPQDFEDCIVKLAKTAADHHEQKMRAQILADAAKPLSVLEEIQNDIDQNGGLQR